MQMRCIVMILLVASLLRAQNSNPWPVTGNVGIGTIIPQYSLDVRNTIRNNIGYPAISIMNIASPGNGLTTFSKSELRLQAGWVQGRIHVSSDTCANCPKGIYFGTITRDKLCFFTNGYETTKMTIDPNGFVGIGTTAPTKIFHIKQASAEFLVDGSASTSLYTSSFIMDNSGLNIGHNSSVRGILFKTNSTTRMTVAANGCVGVGVAAPVQKLEVDGSLKLNGTVPSVVVDRTSVGAGQIAVATGLVSGTTGLLIQNTRTNIATSILQFRAAASGPPQVVVMANGSMGIGTTTPHASAKLDVNGIIRSKEIRVSLNAGSGTLYPDYVFRPGYKLRKLDEVENYIKNNGHLPEIPTATEVEREGLAVGDMQAKLLQKIEELTLYVIEQEKKIAQLQQANKGSSGALSIK